MRISKFIEMLNQLDADEEMEIEYVTDNGKLSIFYMYVNNTDGTDTKLINAINEANKLGGNNEYQS